MTKEKTLEAIREKWMEMNEEEREAMSRLVDQMLRAQNLGLSVRFDKHTFGFFLANPSTNTVVAPPPMNLPTVTAWLDDYEKEAAKE